MRRVVALIIATLLTPALAGCFNGDEDEGPPAPSLGDEQASWPWTNTTIGGPTGREMSLAVDPNDPDRLLTCAPTGTGVVGPGENHSDFWLSLDGGLNWTQLFVERTEAPDARHYTNEGGDCDVAIAPNGMLWTVDSWLGSLAVSWSPDGDSWDGHAFGATIPVSDRPWIRFDAGGRLHMTYQDVQALNPSAIWYTSSTDGSTWSIPTSVTTATPDGAFTWTGDFVVSDDGQHLWSIYTRRNSVVISDPADGGPEGIWIAHSGDGGTLWTNTLLSQREGPSSFLYPSLDMDEAGGLHAAWSEFRGADQPTFYAHSADGQTWTEPVALLEGIRSGAPWVAAGHLGAGNAAVLWSGTPDHARPAEEQRWWLSVAFLQDGGASWRIINTTDEPIWTGPQALFPEFNNIAGDGLGRTHVGAVAPCENEDGFVFWCPIHSVHGPQP